MSATVTVITPMHNNGSTIARTIESLQAERGIEWEQIVIDDGSIDDGPARVEAIAQCDPRVRLLRQSRQGPAAARNRGLDAATGRYLYFLDADDWVLPGGLQSLLVAAESSPHGAAFGGYRCFDEGGRSLGTGQLEALDEVGLDEHLERIRFSIHSQIILRELLVGLRFPLGNAVEDYEFWLRVAERGVRWTNCGEHVAAYRCARGSRSRRYQPVVASYASVLAEAFPRLRAGCWSARGVDLSDERQRSIVRGLATYYAHRALLDDASPSKGRAWEVLAAAMPAAPIAPREWAELAFAVLPFADLRSSGAWRSERARYAAALAPWWRRLESERLAPRGFAEEARRELALVIAGQLIYRPVALASALAARVEPQRPVHLLGFGKNGRALARLLFRRGVAVTARDDGCAPGEYTIAPGATLSLVDPRAPFDPRPINIMTVLHDEAYMRSLPRDLPIMRASDLWREAARKELEALRSVWPGGEPIAIEPPTQRSGPTGIATVAA